jgi:membrane protease YdiL (CAAX protease family)
MLAHPVKTHLPSVAQLIISIIGLVVSVFSVLGLWAMMQLSTSITAQTKHQLPSILWIGFIVSLVAVPSMILSFRHLARKPMPEGNFQHLLLIASVLCALLIPVAYLLSKDPEILSNSFVLILLTILMVAAPIWWFVEFGRNRLRGGSPQRQWGLINFAVFVGMPLVMFIELVILILVATVILARQSDFKPLLMTLETQMTINPKDMSGFLEQIKPMLQKPEIWAAGFFLVCLLLPLVEEIFKPLALWFFIKREWSPSEGFVAGLICGASFALFESITSLGSASKETWVVTLIGRVGTGLLHTATAGLTGWALASAWRDGKYLRVGLAYLVSVIIHGSWNFFALLFGLADNQDLLINQSLSGLVKASPWIMGFLFAGMLTLLFLMNRKIKASSLPPALPPGIPRVIPPPLPVAIE